MTAAARIKGGKEVGVSPVRSPSRARRKALLPPPARTLQQEVKAIEALRQRLIAAQSKVALLLLEDRAYAPIFQRLEREIELTQSILDGDLLTRARAIVAQNEIGRSSAVT